MTHIPSVHSIIYSSGKLIILRQRSSTWNCDPHDIESLDSRWRKMSNPHFPCVLIKQIDQSTQVAVSVIRLKDRLLLVETHLKVKDLKWLATVRQYHFLPSCSNIRHTQGKHVAKSRFTIETSDSCKINRGTHLNCAQISRKAWRNEQGSTPQCSRPRQRENIYI